MPCASLEVRPSSTILLLLLESRTVCNPARTALEHFASLVPNADEILRQIAESTSASISGVQERSRGPRQGGGDMATAADDTSDSSDEDPDCEDEGGDASSSASGVGHNFSEARGAGSGRKRKSGE